MSGGLITPEELVARLRTYYQALDSALDLLAHKQEGRLSEVSGYGRGPRRVRCGLTPDRRGIVVTVAPDSGLAADEVTYRELATPEDVLAATDPFGISFIPPNQSSVALLSSGSVDQTMLRQMEGQAFGPHHLAVWSYSMINVQVGVPWDHPLQPPFMRPSPYIGYGRTDEALPHFTLEAAKQKAAELWNELVSGVRKPGSSWITAVRSCFDTFGNLTRRKSFLERRIHRYLRDHAGLLLPAHQACHFEHPLKSDKEARVADFVLEREAGLAPLLIELESPAQRVFRADGHLTAEANHAVSQITDWVRLIETESANIAGKFAFLAGPKDRLVVIGRGLEHREHLLNTRFSGTTVWTYDLLLEQARTRWNNHLVLQQRTLGLPEVRRF